MTLCAWDWQWVGVKPVQITPCLQTLSLSRIALLSALLIVLVREDLELWQHPWWCCWLRESMVLGPILWFLNWAPGSWGTDPLTWPFHCLCRMCYTPLYFTYKRDHDNACLYNARHATIPWARRSLTPNFPGRNYDVSWSIFHNKMDPEQVSTTSGSQVCVRHGPMNTSAYTSSNLLDFPCQC
jgi:hypothetical protein